MSALGKPMGNPLGKPRSTAVAAAVAAVAEPYKTNWIMTTDRDGKVYFKRATSAGIQINTDQVETTGLSQIYSNAMSQGGGYAAVIGSAAPYLKLYKYNSATALFDLITSPTVTVAVEVALTKDGKYMAIGYNDNRVGCVEIYERTGDTFALKSTHIAGVNNVRNQYSSLKFSDDDKTLLVVLVSSPFLTFIVRASSNNFSESIPTLDVPATTDGYGAAMSPDNTRLALSTGNVAPRVLFYKLTSGTWVKQTDPATLPTSFAYGVDFSVNGNYVVVGMSAEQPFVYRLVSGAYQYSTLGGTSTSAATGGAYFTRSTDGYDSDGLVNIIQPIGNNIFTAVRVGISTFSGLPVVPYSPTVPANYCDSATISR